MVFSNKYPSGNDTCAWRPPAVSKTSTHNYNRSYNCMALIFTLHKFPVAVAPCMAPILPYVYVNGVALAKTSHMDALMP